MEGHCFLFEEGIWLGEGVITINVTTEKVKYFTRWEFKKESEDVIQAVHHVEIQGVREPTINNYTITLSEKGKFSIEGENQNFGEAKGKGVVDTKQIAWEFHGEGLPFEGLEIFHKDGKESYRTNAEFFTRDNLRTKIQGKVWKSLSQEEKKL